MKPYIRIIRYPYEEPFQIHLHWEISNGHNGWAFDYYDGANSLINFAENLESFPGHKDGVFLWQHGSEYKEDRCAYYIRFRSFVVDSSGHCAIQIRFNNNRDLPYREIAELCLRVDAAEINRLGRLFRGFSKLEHELLVWGGENEGLYVSEHEI